MRTEKIIKEPTQKNIRKEKHPPEKEKAVKEKAQTNRERKRARIGEAL
jgi:hypothetical protein